MPVSTFLHQKRWLREASHHLIVALTIASVVLILEHRGITMGLDLATLRFASEVLPPVKEIPIGYPVVRLISESEYWNLFEERSPLDRAKLTTYLASILRARDTPARATPGHAPVVVAIDIDLSPGNDSDREVAAAQRVLDSLIDHSGADIVLTLPRMPRDPAVQTLKLKWVADRCAAERVFFAYADVLDNGGGVIRFAPALPSLGVVARWLQEGRGRRPDGTREANGSSTADDPNMVCSVVQSGARYEQLELLRQASTFGRDSEPTPIDLRHARASERAGMTDPAGRTIFIGGAYDARDRFWTPVGELNGATIHAAVSASTIRTHDRISLLLDVITGTILGFPLAWCWQSQDKHRQRLRQLIEHRHVGSAKRSRRHVVAALLMARLFGGLAIAVAVTAFVGLLSVAALGLRAGHWVNPAPLVFGIFVDSLLANRERWVEEPDEPNPLGPVDLVWQVPVWLIALSLVFH